MAGKYEGAPANVDLLSPGRSVRLRQPFAYIDPNNVRWDVPAGAHVDGASIPQPLWSVLGGPLDGLYRDASIIHDWYCDVRTRSWRLVHRVFYDAMLTSGVDGLKAKVMYLGVLIGGPRWNENAIKNTSVAVGGGTVVVSPGVGDDWFETSGKALGQAKSGPGDYSRGGAETVVKTIQFPITDEAVKELDEWVRRRDPTSADIEKLADETIELVEPRPRIGFLHDDPEPIDAELEERLREMIKNAFKEQRI